MKAYHVKAWGGDDGAPDLDLDVDRVPEDLWRYRYVTISRLAPIKLKDMQDAMDSRGV